MEGLAEGLMGLRISYFLQDGAVSITINLLSSLHTFVRGLIEMRRLVFYST